MESNSGYSRKFRVFITIRFIGSLLKLKLYKCETYKPQGRHKAPKGKRKGPPPSHVDPEHKNDSVPKAKTETSKRPAGSRFPQHRFPQNLAGKTCS